MRTYIILLVLTLFACKKAEDRSCLKFTGDLTEKIISIADFRQLRVGPYLDYVLIQDSANFVKLEGGENVLNFVELAYLPEIKQLYIQNKNKCRFLRNKKNIISVEIHFSAIEEIQFEGSGRLESQGEIKTPNLSVMLKESSGAVELEVESTILSVTADPSWANFIISGHTDNFNLGVKGNAYADTRELKVDSLFTLISRSSVDSYVNVDGTALFRCEIWGNGNIFHTGIPLWQEWNNYGNGQLLKID